MNKSKFSPFSISAASYFAFMLTGIFALYANGGIESLASNTLFEGFAIEQVVSIAQTYMLCAAALLVIKGIHSIVRGRLLALPCLIGDIAFIAVHYLLIDGASVGGAILWLLFIILSAVSGSMNLVFTLIKNA